MKKVIFIIFIFTIIYSCSKTESTPAVTPPVVNKLSSCDSIKQGLLKTTSDTIRLVSCLSITGCDSLRLGILKPNTQDTLRLLSCIKISGCDSIRFGILEPTKSNSDRLGCGVKTIGQNFQGGKIAYILVSGDPGYDVNVKHGLVATVADISSNAQWGCGTRTVLSDKAIGTGNQNTINIMAKCATSGIAARLCGDLVQGGYSDWFLPSKDELNKLFLNKTAIGGFANSFYWSSTDYLYRDYAWYQAFTNGFQNYVSKDNSMHVRAVRAF